MRSYRGLPGIAGYAGQRPSDSCRRQSNLEHVQYLQDEIGVRRILADAQGDESFLEWMEISPGGTSVTLWTQRVGLHIGRRGVGPVISSPMSVVSGRLIPLPNALATMVEKFTKNRDLEGDALLFPGTSGGPMCGRWFRMRRWYPALQVAGLHEATPCRPGLHDLRRACSTATVRDGVDPTMLQVVMGHADSRTTMNIYPQRSSSAERSRLPRRSVSI
jgi:hypothetical protein